MKTAKIILTTIMYSLLFFAYPNKIIAADYAHCASAATLEECAPYKDCNWILEDKICVPNYKFHAEYGDTVSETILYNPEVDPLKNKFVDFSSVINALLPYVLSGAGLILFFMLLSGGFTMLTAVSDPKKAEAGKQRITTAIIGFIIVFAAYWITQFLEIVLGVNIL